MPTKPKAKAELQRAFGIHLRQSRGSHGQHDEREEDSFHATSFGSAAKVGLALGYLGGMEEYDLRPVNGDEAEIKAITELLQTAFPGAHHFTEEVVRWQYKENPEGPAVGFNAWHRDELAGHYVTLPMKATVNGQLEKGLLSLNTATHPAHQGKGLFTKLARATYAHAANAGFGFVAGVANVNSTHGFTKKLGFELVSPLKAMIGLGALPLHKVGADVQFAHAWDTACMAWRLGHPAFAYTAIREPGRAVILSQRKQFGARYVLGLAELPVPESVVPAEKGGALRKIWIGLDPGLDWRGKTYVNIPMRFRPAPLNLIFRDLTDQGRTLDPHRVRWDAMDFDIL